MRKTICIIILLTAIAPKAYSQVLISLLFGDKLNSEKLEFGLDGGFNFSNMSDLQSSSALSSFNLGFYFDILLKDQWYLNTGVLVKSRVGADKLGEQDVAMLDPGAVFLSSGTYRQEIHYFHVPLTIKYRFRNHFYIHGGPQVALRTKANLIFEGTQNNKSVELKTDNRDLFTRLEGGILSGVGYKLKQGKGMNLEIKYFLGLTDVLKDADNSTRNRSFYLAVGIPIGREKGIQSGAE